MRFCLIGPAGTSIPPVGWGAVESLIWDYYVTLKKRGYDVMILNTDTIEMVSRCNEYNPDVVYIMYDDYAYMSCEIQCKNIFFMSHYAYITNHQLTSTFRWYYEHIFLQAIQNQHHLTINALSEEIKDVYIKHGYKGRINVISNGAREDVFRYTDKPVRGTKSIYLAKIEERKGQYNYQSIPDIEFVGNYQDSSFDTGNPNYLGEWTKDMLYDKLTDYGNLLLLSEGEADPLVVKEALIAGLGVVVSECASANLDTMLDFVTVIPDDKLNDVEYVKNAIKRNREISVKVRADIRKYAINTFSWSVIVDKFLDVVQRQKE
jgi:glycosyltransferase involved in cell wall biosynthesis